MVMAFQDGGTSATWRVANTTVHELFVSDHNLPKES
jgi:hypothetical protein